MPSVHFLLASNILFPPTILSLTINTSDSTSASRGEDKPLISEKNIIIYTLDKDVHVELEAKDRNVLEHRVPIHCRTSHDNCITALLLHQLL